MVIFHGNITSHGLYINVWWDNHLKSGIVHDWWVFVGLCLKPNLRDEAADGEQGILVDMENKDIFPQLPGEGL